MDTLPSVVKKGRPKKKVKEVKSLVPDLDPTIEKRYQRQRQKK